MCLKPNAYILYIYKFKVFFSPRNIQKKKKKKYTYTNYLQKYTYIMMMVFCVFQ